jgi:DNA-binding NarL/FixJ family response regulator
MARELAVLYIGVWPPKWEGATSVRVNGATVCRGSADPRELQVVASDIHPSWLLLGAGANEAACVRVVWTARGLWPQLQLAVLGPLDDLERCERWVHRGARVYLASTASWERLVAEMQESIARDIVVVDGQLLRASLLAVGDLSRQQLEILHRIEHGQRNAEIAAELGLAVKTVETHVRTILATLGVRNRTEAVTRARVFGF